MADNEEKFDLVTTELEKTVANLNELQGQLQSVKSSSEQLSSAATAFTDNTKTISSGLLEASTSFQAAVDQLKPIGTTQIIEALEGLKTDFSTASSSLEKRLITFDEAIAKILESSTKLDKISESLAEDTNKLINEQTATILGLFSDASTTTGERFGTMEGALTSMQNNADAKFTGMQKNIKTLQTSIVSNIDLSNKNNEKTHEVTLNKLKSQFGITCAAIAVIAILLILNLIFK